MALRVSSFAPPVRTPSVGLVVTTHRCGPFIDQTRTSVAGQTHPPDQVVVVDDASDDDSVARARAWSSHLNLEVVALARNEGVARARNAGMAPLVPVQPTVHVPGLPGHVAGGG